MTKHRGQSCATCNAFNPNKAANPPLGEPRMGWCCANPPGLVPVTMPMPGAFGAFPTTASNQWCRAWSPAEKESSNEKTN